MVVVKSSKKASKMEFRHINVTVVERDLGTRENYIQRRRNISGMTMFLENRF